MDRWKSDAFPDPQLAQEIFRDYKLNLQYRAHPLCGWRPLPDQKFQTIEINGHGLRSKPMSEVREAKRCVVLGGSVAWGFGTSSNRYAPSYLLEEILKQDYGVDISFINLADQMYSSVEEIQSFIFSVDELDPNFVLCITGNNDIYRGYQGLYKSSPAFKEMQYFFNWGTGIGLVSETSWLKRVAKMLLRGHKQLQEDEGEFIPFKLPDPKDVPHRLFQHKIDVLSAFCLYKGMRVAYVLQPHIEFKSVHSPYEKKYIEFCGEQRKEYFREQYSIFRREFFHSDQCQHADILKVDSTGYFDHRPDTIFFDTAHFTDAGNREFALKLSQVLAPFFCQ